MSNTFGTLFRVTTFGESHGPYMGVVIDGAPSNLPLTKEDILRKLLLRKPGQFPYSSQRKENDEVEIISGVFRGKTTGMPITILIKNIDCHSKSYEEREDLLPLGHAKLAYLQKYGIFDFFGHGRASARETVTRVAAAAIAEKILEKQKIKVFASLCQVGSVQENIDFTKPLSKAINPFSLWKEKNKEKAFKLLEKIKKEKDSIGGAVAFYISKEAKNLGEPIFEKISAKIAYGVMSIPGVKAIEFGKGVLSAEAKGSEFHDEYVVVKGDKIALKTNRSGGILGGIAVGMPIEGKVFFKPTPTTGKARETLSLKNLSQAIDPPGEEGRYDLCIALRASPVVQAMIELVLADLLLLDRARR